MAVLQHLTAAEIVELNRQAVVRFGGKHGLLQENCPERCIENAKLAQYYESDQEDGSTGLVYISALVYYLIENHCFVDGNKRTALAVGLRLFYDLGATLKATSEDLVTMCENVAQGVIPDRPALAEWFAARLIEDV